MVLSTTAAFYPHIGAQQIVISSTGVLFSVADCSTAVCEALNTQYCPRTQPSGRAVGFQFPSYSSMEKLGDLSDVPLTVTQQRKASFSARPLI